MTSATDELHRLLDERGVEHVDGESMTYINDADFIPAAGGTFDVTLYERTPEQAIDATLGRGTCRIGRGTSGLMHVTTGHCSECGAEVVKPARYCPNCGRKVVE